MTAFTFIRGATYTRPAIRAAVGLDPDQRGGDWYTGYARHDGAFFIFCNVGVAGRTGHDYANYFEGDRLHWRGKTQATQHQPMIQAMTAPGAEVHVFWREDDRDPFAYEGLGRAVSVDDATPVGVVWAFDGQAASNFPDEVPEVRPGGTYREGATQTVQVNSYERNPAARRRCVEHYGAVCQICRLDFSAFYGELGAGFIHVHHLRPIAEIGQEYEVDPVRDLIPVCPNCHAMLHRTNPPISPEDLRSTLPPQPYGPGVTRA